MTPRRPTICLTPARNEAWILPLFLKSASVWADHIIVADQQSTDQTRTICKAYPKVEVVDNSGRGYDESNYRQILINQARAVHRDAILVAMDADEVLSGPAIRWLQSDVPQSASPGRVWSLPWINLKSGLERVWSTLDFPIILVDDGSPFSGNLIHSPRIPRAAEAEPVGIPGACLFHLQYLNEDRLRCKQHYYQALEHVRFPRKNAIKIYRTYHHMAEVSPEALAPFNVEWLAGSGVALTDLQGISRDTAPFYWWDAEVLEWFTQMGLHHFRKFDLWDVDWNAKVSAGCPGWSNGDIRDPRSQLDRRILSYLERTQHRHGTGMQRRMDRLLRLFW